MSASLDGLEEAIGYRFKNISFLENAMVHRSFVNEHPGSVSNERLEFLGDAVLGWVVADYCYRDASDYDEGRLTDIRKTVVNAGALAEVARGISLGDYLTISDIESSRGGRDKTSILSDAIEAVFAAVYLDGGVEPAREVILRLTESVIADAAAGRLEFDYKTLLLAWLAANGGGHVHYSHRAEGPAHEPTFHVTLTVDEVVLAEASGGTKKAAEQAAAEHAYNHLHA